MSRERTALETFALIKNVTYDRTDLYGIEEYRKALDIIETVLKNEDSEKFKLIQQVRELKDDVASLESCNSKLWIEKEEYKKAAEIVDLMIKKGVNIVLLDYLYHINPDNAFETYNKEMRQNWNDLYELNHDQFNMFVDYLKERLHR